MPEQQFHTPLPLTLDVSVPAGEIEVETVDGEESTIVLQGDERLIEDTRVSYEGNRLRVEFRGRKTFGLNIQIGSFSRGGIIVRARVPHGSGVKTKTASADVKIAGQLLALDVNTVSGDVRLRGEVAADATVKTVSGDVELERVGHDLAVQSVSGDLRAGPVAGSADTKSVSGDIRIEALTSGDVRFSSVSGDVEIGIASGSVLDVDAGSTSGDLSSEVPLASEPPRGEDVAAPTVVLRGRTVSGDVKVFRAA